MPLVFQYGSNCDGERLNGADRLNGDAVDLGLVQTLDQYEIAFNKWSTTGSFAAADLLKPRKGGRRIWGVLYQVSRAGFQRLIEIEGPGYRPQSITVEDAESAVKIVRTFRVRRARRQKNRHTSADYVRHVVEGLRAHDAPEEYVQHVIAVALETNRRAGESNQIRRIETLRAGK